MLLLRHITSVRRLLLATVFFLSLTSVNQAQSTDVRFATPVRASELVGTIPARDIGDARVTDHFYAITGVPGDLLITIESKNLNGDLDVFTAGELRPLLKISIYAETGSRVAKSIYLRKRESLILRIEARSPNDDSGTYRIRFSGSFEPTVGDPVAETEPPTTEPDAGGRRRSNVSSTGARIEQPAPEVAVAAPTPAPTPEATPEPTTPIKPPPARTARNRRPATRRTTPPKPAARQTPQTAGEPTTDSTADAEAAKKKQTANETATGETPPAATVPAPDENKPPTTTRRPPPRRSTARKTPPPKPTPEPPAQPPPERGARLVIEMNDGTRIEHFMTSVRRVTVENGQVVVVGKDGKIERVPMANVLHMSIGP